MKTLLLMTFTASTIVFNAAHAEQVSGYTRKDGTYVSPHTRTESNGTKFDNYSTKGNYSPNTGKEGTVDPYALPSLSNPYGNTGTSRTRNGW